MSHVASLELCRELYKLSGWKTEAAWYDYGKNLGWDVAPWDGKANWGVPAYDLGYLLRKLPHEKFYKLMIDNATSWSLQTNETNRIYWFRAASGERLTENYDTPEDAAAKLCISLFQQGILTKEQS